MAPAVEDILGSYDPSKPLEEAETIPASWYTDPRIFDLEQATVFSRSWQAVARLDQFQGPGRFVTAEPAGEPIVVVRGADGSLRAFFNVCRHHAAAVATAPEGQAGVLRCPYHGWTYALDGALKACPEFEGARGFDKSRFGLVPARAEEWDPFVFVCLDPAAPPLGETLGEMAAEASALGLAELQFQERRSYELACNWKVFVDNYLDGGYHVPHVHKALGSVLDYGGYTVEARGRHCLQKSPIKAQGGDPEARAVRTGEAAYYWWLYPNFMINWTEGVMDTNLVVPLATDRCRVVFDFYFAEEAAPARERRASSIALSERVNDEDFAICDSVQKGLASRAYRTGRLSPKREGGMHLFHRLLAQDLAAGVPSRRVPPASPRAFG